MEKTEYGYPASNRAVRLTLLPAKSNNNRWCAGTYVGAIYAVPHKPPCSASYPCYGKDANGACWELEGKYVCGIVALPKEEQTEREEKEKVEREAKERTEREAREKAEREAKEKSNPEEKLKVEREVKELTEREARARTEHQERERANLEPGGAVFYSYPGGLPKPIDRSTHIVGHFKVMF
jgi:hypothetical protein